MVIELNKVVRTFVVFLAVGSFLCFQAASEVSGQALVNQIIARMDAYNKSLSALTAKITLIKVNVQLGGVVDTEFGELKYVPDKSNSNEKKPSVRINFKKPERFISIFRGRYSMYQPGTNQAYTGPTSSVRGQTQAGGGALSFMGMNRQELKKNYKYEYLDEERVDNSKKELTWHLRLTPIVPGKYAYAEIWVTKDGLPVQTMIVEKNKDSTKMLMTEHNPDAKIDLGTIAIVIPSTVNVHVEK